MGRGEPAVAVTWDMLGSAAVAGSPSGGSSAWDDASSGGSSSAAADSCLTLSAAQRAAREGNIEVGQRVVVAVALADAALAAWSARCNARGWTFCVQSRELAGLPAGVHQCEVRSDRQIYPRVTPAPPTSTMTPPATTAPTLAASSAASLTQAEPTWLNWQPQPRVIYWHDQAETTYLPTYQPYSQPWQGGSYYTGGGFGGVFSGGACAGGSCASGSCR